MMDYRRSPAAGVSQQNASTNAHIYASFAGESARNTNGILPETATMWWDEERIEATVTRQFVASKLRPDEQLRLDEPLGFGDGLTDDTYMEWIELKAKRIFLILVDIGVPDQIFGVIDDSWDDDDLPIPLDQVERLELTYDKDEKLERKFFLRQFIYLLRNVQKGENIYYDDEEVVPLELAEKRPVGAVTGIAHSNIDKVHLPGRPDDVFIRRRIPLGVTAGRMPQEEFLSSVEAMKSIEHDHIISLWASYIHQDSGYLLLTPVNDSSLKSFLAVTPQSIKILAKQDRRILLLNWIHCLADALSFLHSKGHSHKNIKPSNIMLDIDNHIFLGDYGIFPSALLGDKKGFDKESYDYAAPEHAQLPQTSAPSLRPASRPGTARRGTLPSNGSISSSAQSSSTASYDGSSMYTSSTSPTSPTRTQSFGAAHRHDPQKSDIFSLGTIFLEILTFLLKRASRNFASHRAAKNKTPGRGGGLPDSSFHKNPRQVEAWMNTLAKDASKKEDKIFRGVSHIISLAERMVSSNPDDRPSATQVQERMYTILTEYCGLGQTPGAPTGEARRGRVHCETRKTSENEWDFGFDQLRLASQRAAAEACASVNPSSSEMGAVGVNGGVISGVIYGAERNSAQTFSTSGSGGMERISSNSTGRTGSFTGFGNRLRRNGNVYERESDRMSIATGTSSGSGGKSKTGSGSNGGRGGSGGQVKAKPKAKAWRAPVYAELSFG